MGSTNSRHKPHQKQASEYNKQPENTNHQQESQIYQQKDQQMLKIQYYVYEDLANFLEILVDVSETLKHFQNVEDKSYIPIALNRLIVQNNLSKGIHFDCYYQFQKVKSEFFEEKQKALSIFKTSLSIILQKDNKDNNFEFVKQCIQSYEENLINRGAPSFNLVPLLASNYKAKFNQSVIQKVFGGMQQVEQKQYEIRQGTYQQLCGKDIKKRIEERKEWAKNLLDQNFPIKIEKQKNNEKYDFK